MFLNSVDKKPFFLKKDGKTVRDLTQSMFDFKANNYTSFNLFKVPTDYVMRPDLISQAVYNNTLYAEYILKYNGISNPFSIDEGEVILIPNLESAQDNTKVNVSEVTETDRQNNLRNYYKYIDPTKKPKRDAATDRFQDRNKTKGDQLVEGALPPNIAEEGSNQIVERNGRVYFGENIGQSACLKDGMTSSEFLNNVIRSNNGNR
jgi:hypothetical protein